MKIQMANWPSLLRLFLATISLIGLVGQVQAQLPPDERRQLRQEMRDHWRQFARLSAWFPRPVMEGGVATGSSIVAVVDTDFAIVKSCVHDLLSRRRLR